MKIFLALVLIVVLIVGIIRGTTFRGSVDKMKSLSKDYYDNYFERSSEEYAKNLLVAAVPMIFGGLLLTILELAFYISVVNIAQLMVPTIFMMILFILTFVFTIWKSTKNRIDTTSNRAIEKIRMEKEAAKKIMNFKSRTAMTTIYKIIALAYFVFALVVLITI